MSYRADMLQAQNCIKSDFKLNFTLKVKLDQPQNNRGLNQVILHLWSKVGDPSLNESWVMARTNLVKDERTLG